MTIGNIYTVKSKKDKTDIEFYNQFMREVSLLRKKHIIWTTAELATRCGLNANQASRLYNALDDYRKTGKLLEKPTKVEVTRDKQGKKSKNTDKFIDVEQIYIPNIQEKTPEQYLQDCLFDIRQRHGNEILISGEQTQIEEGFIYIIENPSWPSWVKVGMTVDYEMGLSSYNIYDPNSAFRYKSVRYVSNRRFSEQELIRILSESAQQIKGEWFKIDDNTLYTTFYSV